MSGEKRCRDCAWFDAGPQEKGMCRVGPPQPMVAPAYSPRRSWAEAAILWPIVGAEDWCGAFTRKEAS